MKVYQKLNIEGKLAEIANLEKEVADPDIWKNVEEATSKNQELARLSDETQPFELLKTQISDLKDLVSEEELKEEITSQIEAMEKQFNELKKSLRFQGAYDHNDAIVRITSGAGGTEAMDWAGILERMYLRLFERKGLKVALLESNEWE